MYRSRTDGDTVVHEHQVGGNAPPGRDRRKRDLRNELRGTEVLAAIVAGFVAHFPQGALYGLGAKPDS